MNVEYDDPILFIDIDEDGKFLISKKAVQYIQSIQSNIAVITIVGQYRTGKSYLLNRFAGQTKGFKLGSTTNPCTKGIWIWGQQIKNDNLTILLLDTEGLNSYERDANNDAKLLVLSCLLSSTLIYNVMQVIDEKSLESLSFTTNISKHLQGDDEFIQQYLPNLVWVIRDFGLDLQGISSNSYLENFLDQQQGLSDEFLQRNIIRQAITKYFKNRQCFTLIRPVAEEEKLRNMDLVSNQELRQEFNIQLQDLIDSVLKDLQPKVFQNVPLNGKRLIELVSNYVQVINSGKIPNIENAWERIISKEFNKMIDTITQIITQEIQLPTSYEQVYINQCILQQKAQKFIQQYPIDCKKQLEGMLQLNKLIEERIQNQFQENIVKSKRINQIISNKMYEILNNFSETGKLLTVSQLLTQVSNIKKIFFQESKPPTQYENYVWFMELVLQIMEKIENNNLLNWQRKEDDLNNEIKVLKSQISTLQELLQTEKGNLLKQLETLKQTLQEERIMYEKKLLEMDNQPVEFRKGELFDNPELFIKKDLKNQQLQAQQQFNSTLKEIHDELKDLKDKQELIYQARVQIEIDKIYNQANFDLKEQHGAQIDRIKSTYDNEIKLLKEDRQRILDQRDLIQKQLIEKECETQIFKERLKQLERQTTKDVEHADMLCKVSDQLVKALKKLEKKRLQ